MKTDAMKSSPEVRLPSESQKFSGRLPVHNPHKQFPHCVSAFIRQARPGSILPWLRLVICRGNGSDAPRQRQVYLMEDPQKKRWGLEAPPDEMPAMRSKQDALASSLQRRRLFGSQLLGFALLPHELELALLGFLGCGDLFLHLLRCFFELR